MLRFRHAIKCGVEPGVSLRGDEGRGDCRLRGAMDPDHCPTEDAPRGRGGNEGHVTSVSGDGVSIRVPLFCDDMG